MEQGEQRHHETWRAEAALRAMKIDQRLLDGMQAAIMGQILNGDEIGAVGLAGQHDARVDRVIDKTPTPPSPASGGGKIDIPSPACGGGKGGGAAPKHHRAGPAIPLGATFLGPGRAFMKTKIIQQREVRCDAAQSDHRAATQEMDMATHVRRAPFESQSRPHSSSCDDPQIPHRRKYGKTACLAICKGSSVGVGDSNRRHGVPVFRALGLKRRGTLSRDKIKTINDGLKLAFLPRLSVQKLLHFCHIFRKMSSIAIT